MHWVLPEFCQAATLLSLDWVSSRMGTCCYAPAPQIHLNPQKLHTVCRSGGMLRPTKVLHWPAESPTGLPLTGWPSWLGFLTSESSPELRIGGGGGGGGVSAG